MVHASLEGDAFEQQILVAVGVAVQVHIVNEHEVVDDTGTKCPRRLGSFGASVFASEHSLEASSDISSGLGMKESQDFSSGSFRQIWVRREGKGVRGGMREMKSGIVLSSPRMW